VKEAIKILILEDLPDDVGLVKRVLRKAGLDVEVLQVDERSDFEKALVTFHPEVILSDHALPAFNSIEALEIKKELTPEVPFILVTGTVSEEFAAQCIKQGADDYVLKTNLTRLPVAIKNALEAKKMQLKSNMDRQAIERKNEELTKVNKEMDAFIYSLSHGLRSPLSSILGLVHLAKVEESTGPGRYLHYFDMVETSVRKLDLTIREMVDYSRNARLDVGRSQLDLKALVENCFAGLEYIKRFCRVAKRILVDEVSEFVGDQYRITIILNGLLSNALKFSDHAKTDPYISVRIQMEGQSLTIQVKDNGIGINNELQPHIFKMFYRGSDKAEGAGLGLFVVKEVVEKLGGTINLQSEEGVGTEVLVTIPNYLDNAG
jgi:signal transduction histidine kinase